MGKVWSNDCAKKPAEDTHVCNGSSRFPCKNVRLSDKVVAGKTAIVKERFSREQKVSCSANEMTRDRLLENWLGLNVQRVRATLTAQQFFAEWSVSRIFISTLKTFSHPVWLSRSHCARRAINLRKRVQRNEGDIVHQIRPACCKSAIRSSGRRFSALIDDPVELSDSCTGCAG